MPLKLDLVGLKFGRLVVQRRSHGRHWTCVCECGREHIARQDHLKTSKIRSCGCLHDESSRSVRHGYARKGLSKRGEYSSWLGLTRRCSAPTDDRWADYGGRGIKVCERWLVFENFLADMGPKPSPRHSIDRINNNGDYEPANCRWATFVEQVNNRRVTNLVTVGDKTMSIGDWSRMSGLNYKIIWQRIKAGWDAPRAVFESTVRVA